ncbi:MAG: hypothetical protein EB127_02240 [Alphaproteobacteria bacterium]|nr:hypothetical protein [Alphaproteobacteria bacterium]
MIYAKNASSYHRKMGELLEEMNFGGLGIYQEHIVRDICPDHPSPLDRFDFYIPSLNLVIEVHGEQHYKAATFGGISQQKADFNFAKGSLRDTDKALSAKKSGLVYIAFSYKDNFTQEVFDKKHKEAILELQNNGFEKVPEEIRQDILDYKKRVSSISREYTKRIYQEQKDNGKTGFKNSTGFFKEK